MADQLICPTKLKVLMSAKNWDVDKLIAAIKAIDGIGVRTIETIFEGGPAPHSVRQRTFDMVKTALGVSKDCYIQPSNLLAEVLKKTNLPVTMLVVTYDRHGIQPTGVEPKDYVHEFDLPHRSVIVLAKANSKLLCFERGGDLRERGQLDLAPAGHENPYELGVPPIFTALRKAGEELALNDLSENRFEILGEVPPLKGLLAKGNSKERSFLFGLELSRNEINTLREVRCLNDQGQEVQSAPLRYFGIESLRNRFKNEPLTIASGLAKVLIMLEAESPNGKRLRDWLKVRQ